MKLNREDLANRVRICVEFITRALDKNRLVKENDKFREDFNELNRITIQMTMYLAEFNFYPGGLHTHCCQVAFFTSLTGQRWNLKDSERFSFDAMFKELIRHCQGSCAGTTDYVVILCDNRDDDIVNFWTHNIQRLKDKGVTIEVRMMVGSGTSSYLL